MRATGCTFPLCKRPVTSDSLCVAHAAWRVMHLPSRRNGQTCIERFWAQVDRSGECWLWMGGIDRYGYGKMTFRLDNKRRYWPAHRFGYLLKHGPLSIPEDYTLDHLCEVRACVNPDHLEPVSRSENCRRAASSRRSAA